MRKVAIGVVLALLVLGAAAPAGAQDDRAGRAVTALPRELWDPLPPQAVRAGAPPTAAASSRSSSPVLLTGLALIAAALAGFLIRVAPPLILHLVANPTRPRRRHAPAPPEVVREPPREPEPEPEPEPLPEPVVEAAPEPEPEAALEECEIALAHGWGRGVFEVRLPDGRVVARSTEFPVPRGPLREAGAARAAYRRRAALLRAAGWEPAGNGGDWYATRFARRAPEPGSPALTRGVVAAAGGPREGRFVALVVDGYGNPERLAASPAFSRAGAIEPTDGAVAAHGTLLADLARRGWAATGTLDDWYATTLRRRR